jgi:N-acetyltransferase 10
MGYGARALESLNSFYSGDLLNLDEVMEEDSVETFAEAASKIDKVSWKRVFLRVRAAELTLPFNCRELLCKTTT